MSDVEQDLVCQLERGEDIASVRWSLVPDPERALLVRCAVPRWFDERMFREVIRTAGSTGGEPSIDFKELQDLQDVAPWGEARFRVKPRRRRDLRAGWGEPRKQRHVLVPRDLDALHRELATHLTARGLPDDALYHRLAIAESDARVEFRDAFGKAEQELDLARCQRLLGLLDDWESVWDDRFDDLKAEHTAFLLARTFWAPEHYRTVHYVDRADAHTALESLLGPDRSAPWLLGLHAPGGLGKTTFLCWAAARYCAPRHVPCARLDLDVIDPGKLGRDPWLLGLGIAEQLNSQLPRDPFASFLHDLGPLRDYQLRGGDPDAATDLLVEFRSSAASRFENTLAEALQEQSALIILDTLEEMSLYDEGQLRGVVELLARLHARCPGLRAIVSGRYDISGHVNSVLQAFQSTSARLTLDGFSDSEAAEYMRQRGVTGSDRITAALEKAREEGGRCHPFTLALFAELLLDRPDLGRADIEKYEHAGVAFLVERILERVPRAVRWVMRYGVIARSLSRSFLEHVLLPHLEREMRGTGAHDDRTAGLPPDKTETFALGAPGALDQLWSDLHRYAAARAWVYPDPRNSDQLQFNDNVRRPMQRLLAGQEVTALLHADAARYYGSEASSTSERWGELASEAAYHRFAEGAIDAVSTWQRDLEQARALRRWDWSEALGREALRAYEKGLLDDETGARAHLVVALACARQAEAALADLAEPHWQKAKQQMALAMKKHPMALASLTLDRAWAPLRGRLLAYEKQYDGAISVLDPLFRDADADLEARLEAARLLLELYAELGRWEPARALAEEAFRLASSGARLADAVPFVLHLSQAHEELGRFDLALEGVRRFESEQGARVLPVDRVQLHVRAALLLIQLGEVEAARQLIERAWRTGTDDRLSRLLMLSANLSHANAALQFVPELRESLDDVPASRAEARARAAVLIAFARNRELTLAPYSIPQLYTEAQRMSVSAGVRREWFRTHLEAIHAGLRVTGDARRARRDLDGMKGVATNPDVLLEWFLVDAACRARMAGHADASHAWTENVASVAVSTPRARARLAAGALLWAPQGQAGDTARRAALQDLADALGALEPASARVHIAELLLGEPPRTVVGGPSTKLLALLPPLPRNEPDRSLMRLRCAELLRLAGATMLLNRELRAAEKRLRNQQNAVGCDRALELWERASPERPVDRGVVRGLGGMPDLWVSSALFKHARRRFELGDVKGTRKAIKQALETLPMQAVTVWHVALHELAARHRLRDHDQRGYEEAMDLATLARAQLGLVIDSASAPVTLPESVSVVIDARISDPHSGMDWLPKSSREVFNEKLVTDLQHQWQHTMVTAAMQYVDGQTHRLLFEPASSRSAPLDVQFLINGPALGAMPWELMMIRDSDRITERRSVRPEVRTMYRSVPRVQESRPPRSQRSAPRVLLLQSEPRSRGLEDYTYFKAGYELARGYRRFGGEVIEMSRSYGRLERILASPFDVIHVRGQLTRSRSGESALELLDLEEAEFGVSSFVRSLGWQESEPLPLVILEPPRPVLIGDAVRQLLLRNAFASGLAIQLRGCDVIGAGLDRADERDQFFEALTQGLGKNLPLGELLKPDRSTRTPDRIDDLLGPDSYALFTQEPTRPWRPAPAS